jgi:hypothetical protein
MRWIVAALALLLAPTLALLFCRAEAPAETALRFEVTAARGLLKAPQDGRLLVVLGRDKTPEPRRFIGETGLQAPPMLGADVTGFAADSVGVLDQKAIVFPIDRLGRLPAGDYYAQAVFHSNRDLNIADAPGNLYSDPVKVSLDPAKGGVVKLELTHAIPDDEPADADDVKYIKFHSELLSKFHGRPMYLRVGLLLPPGFDKETDRRYPLRVHIGGYGTRYTAAAQMRGRAWRDDAAPRMLLLHLDGAGPYGDPYQVNSDNNGPYGDAVTQELIPYVEKKYRGIGEPRARVLDGASTGGWVSLALQVFYPDFFNGCWSHAPDPVDFRAYELIDIYSDDNAYVNGHGFERPACRDLNSDVRYSVRHECLIERVLGRGDRWELSGKDWCAWNAVFGPRGKDGLPQPLWDGATGKLDRSVVEHWKKYDLRRVLEKDWKTLEPKLKGKVRIWVGEADDYYLNNAVHLLDASLKRAKPAFDGKITYGPGAGHGFRLLSEKELMLDMARAIEGGKRE